MWMGCLDHGGDTKQGDQMGLGMVYFFLVRLNFHLFVTAQRFFEQTAAPWSLRGCVYYWLLYLLSVRMVLPDPARKENQLRNI